MSANAASLPDRQDVPIEATWDDQAVFPNADAWDVEADRVEAEIARLPRDWNGRVGESASSLHGWLLDLERVEFGLKRLNVYATMSHSVDAAEPRALARNSRAGGLTARLAAATAFAQPEILAVGRDRLREYERELPELAVYAHQFDRLETRREHVRSAEVEELLGAVQDPFRTAVGAHGILSNADLRFEPAVDSSGARHELAHGTYDTLRSSSDRALRQSAYDNYADAHLGLRNGLASLVVAGAKQDAFAARARKYGSSLEAALGAQHVPESVYRNLLETYQAKLPTWHRYWSLRRRALGLDKLSPADVRAPLGRKPPRLSYTQAVDVICEGLAPFGDEYVGVMRRGLTQERWVDWIPNRGKRFGAFSMGAADLPPFILMSFDGDLYGLSTLAHELGHSMHSWLSRQNQPFQYHAYGLFLAEVASNLSQAMVRAHLLATNQDPDFQIAVIEEAFANFGRYFFIMPTLARFELEVHARAERGKPMTAPDLNALCADLFMEGYGPEVEADRDRLGITWAQFSTHLYSNFYVYQYATGLAGAHALAARVLSGEPGARDDVLGFLRSGGSRYPLDTLRAAGVDLERPEAVELTFETLKGYVDQLEVLVARRDAS